MKIRTVEELVEEYMDFPHKDDNEWIYLYTKDVIQHPSPLEVKMMMQNALTQDRTAHRDALLERLEGMRDQINSRQYARWDGRIGYTQALDETITIIQDMYE